MFSTKNPPSPNHIGLFDLDITPSESKAAAAEHLGEMNLNQQPVVHRGWLITTKVINGQLWLRWQHPQESFPRYSCLVRDRGMAETIRHVRFLIDLAINLEQEAESI